MVKKYNRKGDDMICKICQCCGIPIIGGRQYGTNLDKTRNFEYCSLCYTDGRLLRNVLLSKKAKNIGI
ncbi:zinc ribbon domain-containing protein [Sebaldella sp. S0638]|uniref:zinc ribbon domain-containing protein n=1 Tax=Sebaldella sp. S0638 TaxID=2957809 RepID=UPI003532284D